MEYICIIDTETSGLDTSKDKLLEVGSILYHIPSRSIISQASTLLYAEENPVYEINKIKVESLRAVNPTMQTCAIDLIRQMILKADALVAHNAAFDKRWLLAAPDLHLEQIINNKKWICTKNDVTWPIRKNVSLSLISICAELRVPIVNTHRALNDCTLLLRAIENVADIVSFLNKSGCDRVNYHADISYSNRQLAKDNGFLWDNDNKVWHAKLTKEEAEKMPFMVYTVDKILDN